MPKCQNCQQDTTGNHEWNCPNKPVTLPDIMTPCANCGQPIDPRSLSRLKPEIEKKLEVALRISTPPDDVEIAEHFKNGKLIKKTANGIPIPTPPDDVRKVKWTMEELAQHIRLNSTDTYSLIVPLAALLQKFYGKIPAIGLSGFQGENAERLAEHLPDSTL